MVAGSVVGVSVGTRVPVRQGSLKPGTVQGNASVQSSVFLRISPNKEQSKTK